MTDKQALQTLIDGLNVDLAHEYAAVIQYLYNAATVPGMQRVILKDYFAGEIADEIGHAQFLAEQIAALGGTPVVQPAPVEQPTDVKTMLEVSLQGEIDTIRRYQERIQQAEAAGQHGLKLKLEDMLADEDGHRLELEQILKDPRFA